MDQIKISMVLDSNISDVAKSGIEGLDQLNKTVEEFNRRIQIKVNAQGFDELIKGCEECVGLAKIAGRERVAIEHLCDLANLKTQRILFNRPEFKNDSAWVKAYDKQYEEYALYLAKLKKYPNPSPYKDNWSSINQRDLDALKKKNDANEIALLEDGLFKKLVKIERAYNAEIEEIGRKKQLYLDNSFGILNEDEANEFDRAIELAERKRAKSRKEALGSELKGEEFLLSSLLSKLEDFENKRSEIIRDAEEKIASLRGEYDGDGGDDVAGRVSEIKERMRQDIAAVDGEIERLVKDGGLNRIFGDRSNISSTAIKELLNVIQSIESENVPPLVPVEEIGTMRELNAQREYYNRLYEMADAAGRAHCREELGRLEAVEAGWRRAEALLREPVEVGAIRSLGELEGAIAICEERIQWGTEEEAEAWGKAKRAYEAKRDAMRRGVDAGEFDAEARSISAISRNVAILKGQLEHVETADAAGAINREIERWERKGEAMRNAGKDAGGYAQTMEKVGMVMTAVGDVTGGAAKSWLSYGANVMATLGRVIPEMIKLLGLDQAISMAEAIKSGAGVPFPGNIFAIAAGVAAVVGAFAGVPKFADGGIAYGPTLGLFGEYAGARRNPEVVAPLDRLKALIGPGAGGGEMGAGGVIELRMKERELRGVLRKGERARGRG